MQFDLSEEAAWAGGTAGRLRVLQANCSEAPPRTQQEFIAEELTRALKDVVPSKRKLFLETLGGQFPAWLVAPVGAQVTAARAEIVEDTPERRLESLLQIAPHLTEQQQADFAGRLKAAGIAVVELSAYHQATPEMEKALSGKISKVDGDRALKLLALTTAFALTVDQLVWNMWKQMAQKSVIRRDASAANEIRALMRRYVEGDPEVSSQQISQLIDQSRKLTAGLLMAMGGAGLEFAKKFQEKFVPDEIRQLAELERKFTESIEKVCWKKYGEVYKDFGNEAAIDNLIQEAVVRYAEKVMRGQQTIG